MQEYAAIKDLTAYTDRMSKGLIDKLFFVDKIDPGAVVDYGSADGLLLKQLGLWYPDASFVGFDTDGEMNCNAKKRCSEDAFYFTDEWSDVEVMVRRWKGEGRKVALNLSSIIHEVYHYMEPHEVDSFWVRVFGTEFDFIVIRDMIPARSVDRPSDVNDVMKVYRKFLNTKVLHDFQNVWGGIEGNRNLVHFLLKYKYLEPNWDREVKENYLPLYREDLLAMIPVGYEVLYHEHYALPHLKRTVKAELGIEVKDPTHLKLIIERTGD
jgi:hypothetical protein